MPPLSMALMSALGGQGEMTAELMCEWQLKRPGEYRAHKMRSIQAAISGIVEIQDPAIMSSYNGVVL